MTASGRGGQGGHEPRAAIEAREMRVLERAIAGLTQREIAAEEGITQSAVSRILRRVEARVFDELVARVEQQKVRQTLSLTFIYQEAARAWEASKGDAVRRVQQKTETTTGAGATRAQVVSDSRHGDPRYLEVARRTLADQRRIWGLDAPQRLDVRATAGPLAELSDEALAAELDRQRRLLEALDDEAEAPTEGESDDD